MSTSPAAHHTNQVEEDEALFFSVIVPAHNEEQYIEQTLEHLVHIDYPKTRYEVIVVENGSSDTTRAVIERFVSESLRVRSVDERGVSRARNTGLAELNVLSQWVLFLDADTWLAPFFLRELNFFLRSPEHVGSAVGTATIQPLSNRIIARWWFKLHDIAHRMSHSTESLIISRRDVAEKVRFDERLSVNEDFEFTKKAAAFGDFFVFPTKGAMTSVRRYEQNGWFATHFFWICCAFVPTSIRRHINYKAVR